MHVEFSRLPAHARPAIRAHLGALSAEDRFTRFGFDISVDRLDRYADDINFNRDIVIGALYRGLLIGMVHIAVFQADAHPCGELGISVDALCQGKGIGRLLFNQGLLHARKRKLVSLRIQYLRRNSRMASLCRGLSTLYEQDGEETSCLIRLADPDPAEACRREIVDGLELFHADSSDARAHVLFIHGVAGDGWQWRENFQPYFARHGFSSSALSLRGHGGSPPQADTTLRGYEQDVRAALRQLGDKTSVIVGHSMGGFLTQRALENNARIRKAALIASVPPWGLLPSTLEPVVEFLGDPLGKIIASQAAEGKPAYVNPDHISAGMQVIGGSRDRIIPADVVAATARSYDVEPIMIDDAGHAMISSSKWNQVADHVLAHLRA
nr:alpha/beta fold hydrolase [Chromobacterium sp. ASV5]